MVILFMQYLIIFLISMVPLIELRGAIPYAIGFKLPLLPSYIICILGNMLPVPFIFLFARKILVWGSDKKYIGGDRKSTRLNSSHANESRMPSSA